jgi:phospholipase C
MAACTAGSDVPSVLEPGEAVPPAASPSSDAATVALARTKIDHIVFLIKENRTFDNYFGQFPGADGATTGKTAASDPCCLRPTVATQPVTASPTG